MDTALAIRNMRRQSWGLMLKEQSQSGLSIREWCNKNHISTKTFYYRRKQVQTMVLESAGPAFAELVPPVQAYTVTADNRSNPMPGSFDPQLTISIGNAVIGINENTPRQLLENTLEVFRNA